MPTLRRLIQPLAVVSALLGAALILVPSTTASAQSPSPSWKMTDVNTYYGFPSGYNAGAIWADAPGCNGSGTPYYPPSVENEAVNWIDSGLQTIINIDMYSGCSSSLSAYESLASSIESNIASRVSSSAFNRYFYGFMVDEEPWYWTSTSAAATDYASFNSWLVSYEPNIPLSELGNASGYWTQSQYNNVAWTYADPAPQVYNSQTTSNQNSLVGSYGSTTLVTCEPNQFPSPYNTCAGSYGTINGTPWQYSTWGSGYWYNQFQPA